MLSDWKTPIRGKEPVKHKVVILTAGKGSRLNERTKYFNKALLRVGNKAVISHTIDLFHKETEFVIALGYKGDIVRQYLEIAHPNNKFTFIEVDKYSEPGAGPGYALLKCEKELQEPFYFFSCDSLLLDIWHEYKDVTNNWVGYDRIKEDELREKFCTIETKERKVVKYFDKRTDGTNQAFVGVSFIKDCDLFWEKLRQQKQTVDQEIQVAPVFCSMPNLCAIRYEWFDTGSEGGLQRARNEIPGIQNLDKLDEELYVVDGHVVKYFHNPNIVTNRIERAKHLQGLVPDIEGCSKNFYKYRFEEGQDLFKISDHYNHLSDLLNFTQKNLWVDVSLDDCENRVFRDVCRKFYYDKTASRLSKLYKEKGLSDKVVTINGMLVPKLSRIFECMSSWDYISNGTPSNFHGDYNFSNIVLTDDERFKFLDWRQDFGGVIQYGDRYYDFAKMYHSFLFPHPIVKEGKFYTKKDGDTIKTFIEIPIEIERSKDVFEKFIVDNNYDLDKIKILTAIVLLNMSPLHESPLDEYLYYFGKYFFYLSLKGRNENIFF